MSTAEQPTAVDQAQVDLEEICRLAAEGKRVTDPELLGRVEWRAEEARAEDLRLFGVREIAPQARAVILPLG